MRRRQELQRQIEQDEVGTNDLKRAEIGTVRHDPAAGDRVRQAAAQLVDHRLGLVYGDDAEPGIWYPRQDARAGGTEGAAQIEHPAVTRKTAGGDQADQADQLAIAGHRAIEHVGEDPRDPCIEDEVGARRIGASEKPIPPLAAHCLSRQAERSRLPAAASQIIDTSLPKRC